MTDYAGFIAGKAVYPLPGATTNALLFDADPALFYVLEYAAAVLTTHLNTRLVAQKNLIGATQIAAAVSDRVPLDPIPYLQENHFKFPLLYAFRKSDTFTERTIQYPHSIADIELGWILPPLRASEAESLQPILRAAAATIYQRFDQGRDPAYTPTGGALGDAVWDAAISGVEKATVIKATYGSYQKTEDLVFPAVSIQVQLLERFEPKTSEYDTHNGTNTSTDIAGEEGDDVEDFAETETYPPPVLVSISPSTGTPSGGTTVTITGTGFRVGTTPFVLFGGAYANSVNVLNSTTVTCISPEYPAHPTSVVSVQMVTEFGETNTLEDVFTYA